MEKFYVSTSAVYTNAPPHIGFAHESIVADVLARYYRLINKKVFFLTGADEHGLKIYRAAKEAGKQPKEFCDYIARLVKNLKKDLSLSYDYFSRTTDSRHIKAVQKLWLTIQKKGDLEKRKYAGWYCTGCEAFKTEKEIVVEKCPLHPTIKLEWIRDENYFFKLSKYTSFLKSYLQNHPHFILPQNRYNEILKLLEEGLEDVSVSRSRKFIPWGIPVPNDTEQVMYCWFDALTFYISSIGYADQSKTFQEWWSKNSFKLHIVGKDINRFHSCLWTSMLHSAGLPLPDQIFVHGFITSGGERMSKSTGNVINPIEMVQKYGTDSLRYFLLAEGSYGNDIDFTEEKFRTRLNADLANGLGNLVARVAKLCEHSNFEPQNSNDLFRASARNKVLEQSERFLIHWSELNQFLNEYRFDEALKYLWKKISEADHYLDKNKPWLLSGKKLNEILGDLVGKIKEIAILLQPFLPKTSQKIQKQFQGPKIKSEAPLFPRIKL
jgi:methionyl-tRNA synthetase